MLSYNPFYGSLLDVEDSGSLPSLLYYTSEHRSAITSLLTTSGSSNSILVSSSIDGTCKVTILSNLNLTHGICFMLFVFLTSYYK